MAEIPGCRYSEPGTQPAEVACGLADAGQYVVTLLGTGEGPFTVTIETVDGAGQVLDQEAVVGEASTGSTATQGFTLLADGTINLIAGQIFADGFENGDLALWSSTTP